MYVFLLKFRFFSCYLTIGLIRPSVKTNKKAACSCFLIEAFFFRWFYTNGLLFFYGGNF